MIDTIHLGFAKHLDKSLLEAGLWDLEIRSTKNGYIHMYKRWNYSFRGAPIKFKYYEHSYQRDPLLIIDFSLPRLLYGDNVHEVKDVRSAVEEANQSLPYWDWFPEINLWEGKIVRVDLCWNHAVGDCVSEYLKSLAGLQYPHRKTVAHIHEGVIFQSKYAALKFYDKCRESKNPHAYGILRQESTYHNKPIKQITGLKKSFLSDLNNANVLNALDRDLMRLKIKGCSFCTVDTSLSTLRKKYNQRRAMYLLAILYCLSNGMSNEMIIANLGICRDTMNQCLKDIQSVGLVPGLSQTAQLPPLSIPTTLGTHQIRETPTKYQVILPDQGGEQEPRQPLNCKRLATTDTIGCRIRSSKSSSYRHVIPNGIRSLGNPDRAERAIRVKRTIGGPYAP